MVECSRLGSVDLLRHLFGYTILVDLGVRTKCRIKQGNDDKDNDEQGSESKNDRINLVVILQAHEEEYDQQDLG